MKKTIVSMMAVAASFLFLACPKPALKPVKFDLETPFALQVGQTGMSSEVEGFSIKFEKVSADSRCPKGVECIVAGQADVVLSLDKSGTAKTVTLPFTMTNGTTNVTDFEGYTIRVVGLAPEKFKDKEIKPEEYNIMLTVKAATQN